MAVTKLTTYDQVGQVEDVADVIYMISPTDVPFQTSLGKPGKAKARLVEWQEDSLAGAADNAQVEGADAPAASHEPTVMRSNYTQIFAKTCRISGTAQAIDLYGRDDDLAREISKKGKELRFDLERAMVGVVQNAVAGNSSTTARRMASALAQISSATTKGNAGTARALTEAMWIDVLEALYNEGGEANTVMIPVPHAKRVAEFAYRTSAANVAQRTRSIEGTEVINAVDVYLSPYGQVKVAINRHLKKFEGTGNHAVHLFYTPSNWKLLALRNWQRKALAITGDSEAHELLGEFTLRHNNQKASGLLTDLNDA